MGSTRPLFEAFDVSTSFVLVLGVLYFHNYNLSNMLLRITCHTPEKVHMEYKRGHAQYYSKENQIQRGYAF
jgi:hypothetical protein